MNKQEILQRNREIIRLSNNMSQKEIAKLYNLTQSQISNILRKNGIKLPKFRLNMSKKQITVDYFDKIDDPKKAYWLGFICADGYINPKGSKLSLCIKDLEILEKFKKDIRSEHTISTRVVFDKRTNKTYKEYMLQITNSIFVSHLLKHGITSNKTNVLNFPKISEEYYSYFIAGLFDGDGSLFIRKNNTIACNLISTKEILSFIDNYLFNKLNIKVLTYNQVTLNKNNVFKRYWYKDAMLFLNYIYQGDSIIYLSRKYNKYVQYKNRGSFDSRPQ